MKFLCFDVHPLFFFWQYSYYDSIKISHVPKAVVSTIGGEQGGRAPIVIEDENIQAAAPEKVETMADPGKAEPGRDVFAGEPVKDIKSNTVPIQPPEQVREQKEISSVIVGTLTSSSSLSSTTSTSDATEDSTGSAASAASETAQPDTTTIESATAKVKVAGPLGEEELEAQKVANELYPDAEN